MILPDHEIRRLCTEEAMVVPFDPELLNPASLDVTLGNHLMIEVEHTPELQLYSIEHCTEAEPYWLQPREFVLAKTREIFNLPDHVAAQFVLKSSRAREGLEHLLAGFADPGFNSSVLTLELHNSRQLHPISLWPGMKVGQMIFNQLSSAPLVSYAIKGHYNGDSSVTASRGHL